MEKLNFDLIRDDALAAVHCPTEDIAKIFLECLRKEYPQKHFYDGGTNWKYYGPDTCYWPEFKRQGSLTYGSLDYAISENYHVYEFSELCAVPDLPLDEFEVDIKSLFGME